MYARLWFHLPGPTWVRALILAAAAALILGACFTWVFPAVLDVLQGGDANQVGETSARAAHTVP